MQVLQLQIEVRPDPAEVGRARRWARARLQRSGIDAQEPIAETLILIVSELVTNAVVHTGCPAVLSILLHGGPEGAPDAATASGSPPPGAAPGGREAAVRTVRVEVADASRRPPRPRLADGEETGGRGLALVDGLADRWGWEPSGAGKRIWCELDRFDASPASRPSACCNRSYQGVAAYEAV
ncbi:ATP-binding protein [Streptomyces sp. TS71-3]|uniref:ATP-binding protein n=1 Tax=Streptomyces sp. TS71-3 TaxID=2733862 RepID=UPI001B05DEC4|nr:ATP-binding protein [Streptomyces sp. TS71-3]GHJ39854.1 ATP-binding protein [Streptomyces sp. TS71-3]